MAIGALIAVGLARPAASAELGDCAALQNDPDRLACYDALAGRPSVTSVATLGGWDVQSETNPLDDSTTVFVARDAAEGHSRRGPVRFYARCKSDKTEVYVSWGTYVGDDSYDVYEEWKRITLRLGDGAAEQERWDVSTSRESTFAPQPINLLSRMVKVDRLVLQLTPYGANPITAIFPTEGLREALQPLTGACHWTLTAS